MAWDLLLTGDGLRANGHSAPCCAFPAGWSLLETVVAAAGMTMLGTSSAASLSLYTRLTADTEHGTSAEPNR